MDFDIIVMCTASQKGNKIFCKKNVWKDKKQIFKIQIKHRLVLV